MATLQELIEKLPAHRRAEVAARTTELFADEIMRRDLRKVRKIAHAKVGRKLGVSRAEVLDLERNAEQYLLTLRKTVEARGGHLSLIAELPGRRPVVLGDLALDCFFIERSDQNKT